MTKKSPVKSTLKTVVGLCLPKKANFDLNLLLHL